MVETQQGRGSSIADTKAVVFAMQYSGIEKNNCSKCCEFPLSSSLMSDTLRSQGKNGGESISNECGENKL